ncbi:MAG: hypothetical protein HY231_03085 [Acidobacteria bacterium]|nr:hypothetical protein [Acidobacteriota bacterium]
MADRKTKPRKENFVSKIVKNPDSPPDTLLLRGYLGESSEAEHTRLYFDATLSSYVEIPDDAILHEEDVPKEQSPLGESFVWIKQDAEVIHGKAGPQRTKAKFFEGPIAQAAAQAAAAPIPPPTILCPTQPAHCPSVGHICVSQIECPPPSPLHGCPPVTLPPGCLHTPFHGCPTPPVLCPPFTPLHGCPPHTPQFGCPPFTPFHGCPPFTPLHGCPPHTPLHGCPPHTPLLGCPTGPTLCCPTHVAPSLCCPPLTPVHGCPTPLCTHPPVCHPPTPACPTPVCPSHQIICHPTNPIICNLQTAHCPTLPGVHCPPVSGGVACPTGLACGPQSIACGVTLACGPGGGPINQ